MLGETCKKVLYPQMKAAFFLGLLILHGVEIGVAPLFFMQCGEGAPRMIVGRLY